MAELVFTSISNKNEGLIFSPSDLFELYFFGLNLKDRKGNPISDSTIKNYIGIAQKEVENYLNIKLVKTLIEESRSFYRQDFLQWNHVNTSYPVLAPVSLEGWLNKQKQITYPEQWISSKVASDGLYQRIINLVPNQGGVTQSSGVVFSGLVPQLGLLHTDYIPNYWRIKYITGFENIPLDILNVIGQMASIPILAIFGNIILPPGMSNVGISIDGLSQNFGLNNQGAFADRINFYLNQLKETLPRLKNIYKGIAFEVL